MDPLKLTNNGLGVRLSCTDVSSRVAIPGNGDSLCVTNPGNTTIYMGLGGSTFEATTAGYPILPGTKEDNLLLDVDADWYHAPYIAGICESGVTGTLIVQRVFR